MLKRLGFTFPGSLGFLNFQNFHKSDHDQIDEKSKYGKSIYAADTNETGKNRLYMMYSTDEFGNTSPEIVSVIQSGMLGLFMGGCMGGFYHSRNAYMNFMERNQATAFHDHIHAKKKLQDTVTVNFGKGAFKWGWRLGLFSSSYVLITTSIAVYRGRSGLLEYITAGGLTGAAYKTSLGFRGMLVGGILGSILGGVAGAASLGILKLSGTTMEEVRYWQYQWKTSRTDAERRLYKADKDQTEDPLILNHDKNVQNKITLDSIPDATEHKSGSSKS